MIHGAYGGPATALRLMCSETAGFHDLLLRKAISVHIVAL